MLATSCGSRTLAVELDFEPDSLAGEVAAAEVFVVASCPASVTDPPAAALARVSFRRGETAAPLGGGLPERFAVLAIGRDADCATIAAGCTEVERATASTIRVLIRETTGPACPAAESCERGLCCSGATCPRVADAGLDAHVVTPTDAALDASSDAPPDAHVPVDAPIVCMPACQPGELCTASGCRPTHLGADRIGECGTGGCNARILASEDGDAIVAGEFGARVVFGSTTLLERGVPLGAFVAQVTRGTVGWVTQIEVASGSATPRAIAADGSSVWVASRNDSGPSAVEVIGPAPCATRTYMPIGGEQTFVVRLGRADGCARDGWFFTSPPVRALAARGGGALMAGGAGGETANVFDCTVAGDSEAHGFVASIDDAGGCDWISPIHSTGEVLPTAVASDGTTTCAVGWYTGTLRGVDGAADSEGTGGFVECLEVASGARRFRWQSVDTYVDAAAISGGVLVVTGRGRSPVSFLRADGSTLTLAGDRPGRVDEDGYAVALSTTTGRALWGASVDGIGAINSSGVSAAADHAVVAFTTTGDAELGGTSHALPNGGFVLARIGSEGVAWSRPLSASIWIDGGGVERPEVVGWTLGVVERGNEVDLHGWWPGRLRVGGVELPNLWNPFFTSTWSDAP